MFPPNILATWEEPFTDSCSSACRGGKEDFHRKSNGPIIRDAFARRLLASLLASRRCARRPSVQARC